MAHLAAHCCSKTLKAAGTPMFDVNQKQEAGVFEGKRLYSLFLHIHHCTLSEGSLLTKTISFIFMLNFIFVLFL